MKSVGRHHLWALVVPLTALNLWITFLQISALRATSVPSFSASRPARQYSYEGTDISWKLPIELSEAAMEIKSSVLDLTDDAQWAATVPPHQGRVRLGPSNRTFAVSMYHQLHCLNILRKVVVDARDNRTSGSGSDGPELAIISDHDDQLVESGDRYQRQTARMAMDTASHVEHCLPFLLQGLLCRADITLEHSAVLEHKGEKDLGASGVGDVHRCGGDWAQVRRFVEDNQATW